MEAIGTGNFKPVATKRVIEIAVALGIKLNKVKGGRDYIMSPADARKIENHIKRRKAKGRKKK